jgi:hypothetical protein
MSASVRVCSDAASRLAVALDRRVLMLPCFDWMAGGLPFLKAAEKRPGIRETELSEHERRTGARFLRFSTAVRDDRFSEASQPLDTGLNRGERNRNRTRNMAGGEAVVATHIYNGHGAL